MTHGDIAIAVGIVLIGLIVAVCVYGVMRGSLTAKPDRTEFDQDWRGDGW